MVRVYKRKFSDLSDKESKDWELLLQQVEYATVFQTSEWIGLIVDFFNEKAEVILCYEENELVGVFPYYLKKYKRIFNKSTTTMFETPYGGPITRSAKRNDWISQILDFQLKGMRMVSSKIVFPPHIYYDSQLNKNCVTKTKSTIELNIDKPEEVLWTGLNKMKTRNIKKAIKNELEISEDIDRNLEFYYDLLAQTYSQLGLPKAIDFNFYRKLFDVLSPQKRVKLVTVLLDSKPIASAIFLLYNNTIMYWQGASSSDYMKYGPNDLIHWYIIKNGKSWGYTKYNMLHFHDANGNEISSLKNYKLSFGSELQNYIDLTINKI